MIRHLGQRVYLASVTLVALALLLGGCTTADWPDASPAFTPAAECERAHGVWRPDIGWGICEGAGPIR